MVIQVRDYSKYLFMILFLGAIYLSYLVIKPFIVPILTAAIVAYVFYPLYKKIKKKLKRENLSATITALIVVLLIAIPSLFLINAVAKESFVVYVMAKDKLAEGNSFMTGCDGIDSLGCNMFNMMKDMGANPQINFFFGDALQKATSFIIEKTSSFIFSIPARLLDLFIILFVTFYLFKDGEKASKRIIRLIPLKKKFTLKMEKQFSEVTFAVVYGHIITAIVQGLAAGLGFWVFGVKAPILWGMLTAFFSLIPFLGAAAVWIPVSLVMFANSVMQSDGKGIALAIGLFAYGLVVISMIDNIIKPKIVSKRADIHPAIVLVGVLGGLAMMGIIGVIVGPLILALTITFITLYEQEKGKISA